MTFLIKKFYFTAQVKFKIVFDSNNNFFSRLASVSFDQLVNQPTHIEGGIIDHLYVRKVKTVKTFLHHPYYSDHDGVLALFKIE